MKCVKLATFASNVTFRVRFATFCVKVDISRPSVKSRLYNPNVNHLTEQSTGKQLDDARTGNS